MLTLSVIWKYSSLGDDDESQTHASFQHEIKLLHDSARKGDLMTISKLAGEKRCAWSKYCKITALFLVQQKAFNITLVNLGDARDAPLGHFFHFHAVFVKNYAK